MLLSSDYLWLIWLMKSLQVLCLHILSCTYTLSESCNYNNYTIAFTSTRDTLVPDLQREGEKGQKGVSTTGYSKQFPEEKLVTAEEME